MTLIYLTSYKRQFFIDEVLQCLVDKYQITYQNILGDGVVRPHLVESSYCKTLGPLKNAPIDTIFNTKNIFSSCCYIKENFKNNETYQTFFGERAVRSPGKRVNVTSIHPMSYKPQILTDAALQCLLDRYVITCQNIWGEGVVRPHEAIVTLGDC